MKKHMTYIPHGVCSRKIEITLDDGIVSEVVFTGGCSGNTAGLSKIIKGMRAEDVIEKLEGTHCGLRETSCPDQLAKALRECLNEKN